MPVTTALTLNVEKVALGATESVNVADTTWLAANVAPSRFQLTVIGPLAVVGFQFVLVRLSVTWELPAFLT